MFSMIKSWVKREGVVNLPNQNVFYQLIWFSNKRISWLYGKYLLQLSVAPDIWTFFDSKQDCYLDAAGFTTVTSSVFGSGSLTIASNVSSFFTSNACAFFSSFIMRACLTSFVCFRRLGDSFKHWTKPL